MMSTLIVLLVYSPGMPIVYIIGFVFFFLTYQVNKLMLFRYYKRTDSALNSSLPLSCLNLLKFCIFFKVFAGLGTFTQPQIWLTKENTPDDSFTSVLTIDIKKILENNGIKLKEHDPTDPFSVDFFAYLTFLHQQWYLFFTIGVCFLYLFQKMVLNVMVVLMTAAGAAIINAYTGLKRCIQRMCFCQGYCVKYSA